MEIENIPKNQKTLILIFDFKNLQKTNYNPN